MKTYKIFTWKLANKLNSMGFTPVGKALNYKDPTKVVILFEDTPELRQAVSDLLKK